MKNERKSAVPTSIRLSESSKELWESTAAHLGLSLAATFELAIRRLARAEGVIPTHSRVLEKRASYGKTAEDGAVTEDDADA
jgi:hypothetical protein